MIKRLFIALIIVFISFGTIYGKKRCDFNNDGKVNIMDLLIFLGQLSGKNTIPDAERNYTTGEDLNIPIDTVIIIKIDSFLILDTLVAQDTLVDTVSVLDTIEVAKKYGPYEPNDNVNQPYGPLANRYIYRAFIEDTKDVDWFFFGVYEGALLAGNNIKPNHHPDFSIIRTKGIKTISKIKQQNSPLITGINYKLSLTSIPKGQDYDMALYNQVDLIAVSENEGNADETIEIATLPDGWYYVSIYPFSGCDTTDTYEFFVTWDREKQYIADTVRITETITEIDTIINMDTVTVRDTVYIGGGSETTIESNIDGSFEGFNYGTLFQLKNGEFWQQVEYTISIDLELSPKVVIWQSGSYYYMAIENVDKWVKVSKVKNADDEVIKSKISGNFSGWSGNTLFSLDNGQIWQQDEYSYKYAYKYHPGVTIFKHVNGYYVMVVEGINEWLKVKRVVLNY